MASSSSKGLSRPLSGLSCWMICWAFSGLSQKFGWPICSLSLIALSQFGGEVKDCPAAG